MNPLCNQTRLLLKPLLLSLLVVCCALQVSPAFSQASEEDGTSAEEHSRLGVEFYKAEKFPEAIREMIAAYRLVPDAGLLYNIARIYHRMGEWDLAIDYYKKYVAHDEADPNTVQKSLVFMKELRAGKNNIEAGALPQIVPQPQSPPVATKPMATPAPTPGPTASPEKDDTMALVVAGGGLALITTGVVLGSMASSESDAVSDPGLSFVERLDAQESGELLALSADISIISGLLVLGTGVMLLVYDSEQAAPLPAATLDFTFNPGSSVGAQLSLPFD